MEGEAFGSANIVPCELLDVNPGALDYAIRNVTHRLVDRVMCELEKGESICSLSLVEQNQFADLNSVEIRRTVNIKKLIRCKECKHRPKMSRRHFEDHRAEHEFIEFPDYKCPCRCDDPWYSYVPLDDFFCAYGETETQE